MPLQTTQTGAPDGVHPQRSQMEKTMKYFLASLLLTLSSLFITQRASAQVSCPGSDLHCATVSWTAGTGAGGAATGYNVYRTTVTGGCSTVTGGSCHLTGNTTTALTYTDSPLAASTTYYYVITATNSSGESGPSAQSAAFTTTADPITVPATPTNVTVTGK